MFIRFPNLSTFQFVFAKLYLLKENKRKKREYTSNCASCENFMFEKAI